MNTDDNYDYWTEAPQAQHAASEPVLTIEAIEGVEPLNDQFGVAAPLTVPAPLQQVMFGQPEPTEAEIEAVGGDAARVPPLQTYAILDAAKVTNLPEMLEASGLTHRCLFKGDAHDALKDVAPWIVQLKEDNPFTRNLFTRGEAGWHLWDKEPGIYIRSGSTLDEMWKHFRKFTRVQDEDGHWFYLAFWRGHVLSAFSHEDCLMPLMAEFSKPICSVHWFATGPVGKSTFVSSRFIVGN